MSQKGKSWVGRLDGLTLLLYFILVFIGLATIFSVEYRSTDSSYFLMHKSHMRQAIWLGISLFVGLLILLTNTKFFSSVAYLSYALGLLLLLLTIFLGTDVKGSQSWLGVGSFRFQPGEVCKTFTALAIAKFLSSPETDFRSFRHRLLGILFALVPGALIVLQKETGLALVYLSFFLVLYREGLPTSILVVGISSIILTLATLLIERQTLFWLITGLVVAMGILGRKQLARDHLAKLVLLGSWGVGILFSQALVPYAFENILQRHQVERIYSTLGQDLPEAYQRTNAAGKRIAGNVSDYNVRQSKIAIGSGGLWGKGYLHGTSTKNSFVPEQNTDFIFCAVGEQFGFMGSSLVVLLYLALLMRISFLAERQRSSFSRIYAYCVASVLFFHVLINISMTIGLVPVIGITLPFLSYGGSSLLSFSVMIFILVRLDADRQLMIR